MCTTEEPAEKKTRIGVRSLKTADDIRRLLARLIKARLADQIDSEMLRAITAACIAFLKAAEAADTDNRLQAIEQQLEAYEKERS